LSRSEQSNVISEGCNSSHEGTGRFLRRNEDRLRNIHTTTDTAGPNQPTLSVAVPFEEPVIERKDMIEQGLIRSTLGNNEKQLFAWSKAAWLTDGNIVVLQIGESPIYKTLELAAYIARNRWALP